MQTKELIAYLSEAVRLESEILASDDLKRRLEEKHQMLVPSQNSSHIFVAPQKRVYAPPTPPNKPDSAAVRKIIANQNRERIKAEVSRQPWIPARGSDASFRFALPLCTIIPFLPIVLALTKKADLVVCFVLFILSIICSRKIASAFKNDNIEKRVSEKLDDLTLLRQDELDKQYKTDYAKYETDYAKHEKNLAQAEQDFKEASELYKTKCAALAEQIASTQAHISEQQKVLDRLYSSNVIFSKYRNLVALSSFLEYFASGRVETLKGSNGAYNLFEAELRQARIVVTLQNIGTLVQDGFSNLSAQLRENQYVLYNAITEASNRNAMYMGELSQSMSSMSLELSQSMSQLQESADEGNKLRQRSLQSALLTEHYAETAAKNAKLSVDIQRDRFGALYNADGEFIS
ncbi:MAG: hypothetical protein LBQ91_06365 [Oscillospiraceae bacterium]|jgi:hypothetical protein|nr:hypothetical protein [Oscillospiraceae bacterium]